MVTLKGLGPGGKKISFDVPISFKGAYSGTAIHKLAAFGICKDLQENTSIFHIESQKNNQPVNEQEISKLIIELGTKYQLATNLTSFIATEERDRPTEGTMIREKIKTIITLPSSIGINTKCALKKEKVKKRVTKNLNVTSAAPVQEINLKQSFKPKASSNRKKQNFSNDSNSVKQAQKVQSKDTQIILTQKAVGCWETSDVCSLLSLSPSQLSEKNPSSDTSVPDEIKNQLWATAVIIAYLNAKFAASKDLWELVESKAKQFLKKTQHKYNLTQLDFLSSAEIFVTTLK